MTRKYPLWLVGFLFLLLIGWYFWAAVTPSGQPPLKYLTEKNVADFQRDFNAASGKKRLVLLVSPT